MPGAPPSLLLWLWCFLCWFSLLFTPSFSLSKALSSLFKSHYYTDGQGVQLCPAVVWLELAGTGHVQHRAALAFHHKGHPADLTASAWAQTYNSSAFLTSMIMNNCTLVFHPHIYMYLIRCFYFPHRPLIRIWSLMWKWSCFLRKEKG